MGYLLRCNEKDRVRAETIQGRNCPVCKKYASWRYETCGDLLVGSKP
jgi:hypothetical protein